MFLNQNRTGKHKWKWSSLFSMLIGLIDASRELSTNGSPKIEISHATKFQNVNAECLPSRICLLNLPLENSDLDSNLSGCFRKRRHKLCTMGDLATMELSKCGIHFHKENGSAVYSSELALNKDVIRWQCSYNINDTTKQQSNITKLMVPESAGSGKFLMSFLLYEDEKYSKPMSLNPSLQKGGLIRARVYLLNHINLAKLQLSRCWATPYADPNHEPFDLITNFCPLKENGANTTIIESEIAHYATFESGIFKFDQSETVYLHCHVRVCFQDCDIDCSDRSWRTRRASNSQNPDTTISLGPITVPEHVSVEIHEVYTDSKNEILSKNPMFDHSTIRIPPSLLWTLVLTLLASAIALATILVRWLAEDRKLNQAFLNSPTRSRTESVHTDTSTTEISA